MSVPVDELEAYRRRRRRELYLRETGRPLLVRGAERDRIVARLRSFQAQGMSRVQMARQVGMKERTLRNILLPEAVSLKRRTLVKLEKIRFEEPDPTAPVGPAGTRRRLGALWAEGFPVAWLAGQLDIGSREYIQALIRGSKGRVSVTWRTHKAVAGLYEKLEGRRPAEFGIDTRRERFSAAFARKKRIPPRHCWDADTIDDPEAFPEWTGACGTPSGRRIHNEGEIPLCPACEAVGREERRLSPELLRRARLRTGMSQVAFAREAGLKVDQYRSWESGRTKPRYRRQLDQVLVALDMTFDEITE